MAAHTLVSFDIDGTLETGDPAGPIGLAFVRWGQARGWVIGSCSDRTLGEQSAMWERAGIVPDFVSRKHELAEVRAAFPGRRFVHIGDTQVDEHFAGLAGFEFIFVLDLARRLADREGGLMTSGIQDAHPAAATPVRRPGSVRRTTTHDSLRPDGLLGPVTMVARGRDLRTTPDGASTVLDAARLDLEVSHPEREVGRITGAPAHPGLQALVGVRASSGFRRAVDEAIPGERTSRSVRFQLLDDVPTAVLVSGYAIQVSGVKRPPRPKLTLQHPDLCAGWMAEGTLVAGLEATGVIPTPHGPQAPSVDPGEDPLGWHEFDPLPPDGMRRRRRLDVWREGDVAMVECFFRDSHMSGEGVETVLHEYTVHATFDSATQRFLSSEADIGALPWPECPAAAASATRLAGAPAEGLRGWVRDTFTGRSTCTHLNDTLRSLEDVHALVGKVDE